MNLSINIKRYTLLKKAFLLLAIVWIAMDVHGQVLRTNAVAHWNNDLSRIAYPPKLAGWYEFKPGIVSQPLEFFNKYGSAIGLEQANEMRFQRVDKDKLGANHYRFQQYYRGIKIEGGEYILHEYNNFLTSAHGKMVYGLNKPITPSISEAVALRNALKLIPASLYKINRKDKNSLILQNYRPKGELVFQKAFTDSSFIPQNFALAWHFTINKASGESFEVYINASNGEKINILPLQSDCNIATVSTNFYGNQNIYTTNSQGLDYMLDDCTSSLMFVYDNNNDTVINATNLYSSFNNNWNSSINSKSAGTSLWCCRKAKDFYYAVFGRDSYDNAGGDVNIYQNFGFLDPKHNVYYSNAAMSFGGGQLFVGNNEGPTNATNTDDYNTLDIIGHEYTHAVTAETSKLLYQGESGALNESFSDILGTYIEYWDGQSAFDWLLGEDRGNPIRDMSNPKSFQKPTTYKGGFWYFGAKDKGGVHTNSGVQNFWDYLLSAGGQGVNDNFKTYAVTGIGIEKASLIAYNADAYYMVSSDQYADARIATLTFGKFYFGYCSNECIQIANAWYAAGVGGSQSDAYNPNVCGNYTQQSQGSNVFSGIDILPVSQGCTAVFNPSPYPTSLDAGKEVHLYPGTTIKEGVSMTIYILDCALTNIFPSAAYTTNTQNHFSQATLQGMLEAPIKQNFMAYPNPTNGLVNLSFTLAQNESDLNIKVFSVQMQEVAAIKVGNMPAGKQNYKLNLSQLSTGIYYVMMMTKNGNMLTKISIIK